MTGSDLSNYVAGSIARMLIIAVIVGVSIGLGIFGLIIWTAHHLTIH